MFTSLQKRLEARLSSVGQWLATHQASIRRMQWGVVGGYLALLAVPAVLPLPGNHEFIWNNVTRFAQFVFWGLWWPGVVLATALFGRVWCGLLCPEGFLSERVSTHGRGRALPRWLLWGGWPTTAFVTTTLYGQLTSVYQYPRPAVLTLGGSTIFAMAIGWFYGRNKRVWCRYLCPASSVFGLLAKIAPFQFEVDQKAWKVSQANREIPGTVNCAPMLPLRTMVGASDCHMCGRCSGFRKAIMLRCRSPSREIVEVAGLVAKPHETVLVLFALAGLVTACFQWSSSLLFFSIRAGLADLGARHHFLDALVIPLPWWMLTNYPERNDVMLPLDALSFLLFAFAFASLMAASLTLLIMSATLCLGKLDSRGFHHLAQTLIPVTACGLFTGLLSLPAGQLRMDGIELPWLVEIKWVALPLSVFWCARLGYQVARRYYSSPRLSATCAAIVFLSAMLVAAGSLGLLV